MDSVYILVHGMFVSEMYYALETTAICMIFTLIKNITQRYYYQRCIAVDG